MTPLDCMGCGECITVCPTKAIEMVPQETQLDKHHVCDYLVANVSKKTDAGINEFTPKGSQFNQPLLDFSGSCAGCAETAYARLLTHISCEQPFSAHPPGCSYSWGGPAAL